MNVSWKHKAQQYLYSNNFPTCAIHIIKFSVTSILCMPVEISKHSVYLKQGETLTAAVKILKIYVLAWSIICLQIISQKSAELKNSRMHKCFTSEFIWCPCGRYHHTEVITVLLTACLPACPPHTSSQSHGPSQNSIPLQDRTTFKADISVEWRGYFFSYKMRNTDIIQISSPCCATYLSKMAIQPTLVSDQAVHLLGHVVS